MVTNQILTLDDIVFQGKGNIVSDMGGEKVMLSVENGKYYNLGEVGGEIWELIESPILIKRIVETLIKNYQVEKTVCEQQVMRFLERLLNEELIGKQ